jgi:hypothetical protein
VEGLSVLRLSLRKTFSIATESYRLYALCGGKPLSRAFKVSVRVLECGGLTPLWAMVIRFFF